MPDNTNDIDALLRYLNSGHSPPNWYEHSTRWHAALTALVAERNGLRKERDALRIELTNAKSFWRPLDERRNTEQRQESDRDLRERDETLIRWMDQVTAMLCHSMTHSHDAKQELVNRCDKAIAAMRKEVANGK